MSIIPISARGLRLGFGLGPRIRRHVHATSWVSKSVKEKLSEVADKVNKKVGEGLATAIETGEKATEKTKQTLGATTKHVSGKSERAKARVKQAAQRARKAGDEVEGVLDAKETGRKPKDL